MNAGFARKSITPPLGTRMQAGWAHRDHTKGAQAVHDDLFVRSLFLEDNGERAVIAAFDVLFFSRALAEWVRGAIARRLDLLPRQILLNTSHTHSGPRVSDYAEAYDQTPDWRYWEEIVADAADAAETAAAVARPAEILAGVGRTRVPMSRRRPDGRGGIAFRPNPAEPVYDQLPVCLVREPSGRPISLLFSIACHPSTRCDWEFSAEYPGVACARLDAKLGEAVSMFLQGAGGETKASVIADGVGADGGPNWRGGTWEDIARAGEMAATEVQEVLERLEPRPARIRTALFETRWPLQPAPTPERFAEALKSDNAVLQAWAARHLEFLRRGFRAPRAAGILAQGVTLAEGVRIVAFEGELVGELATRIAARFGGVTFPLGFSNGMGLYLVSTRMLREGGYEPGSYFEYNFDASLAEGTEAVVDGALDEMSRRGIC